jgi:hypothetical protein
MLTGRKNARFYRFDQGSAMSARAFDIGEDPGFHDGLLPVHTTRRMNRAAEQLAPA